MYYVLRSAYSDRGTAQLPCLTAEKVVVLRNPLLAPEQADRSKGTEMTTAQSRSFYVVGTGSYLGYEKIDLTGIRQVEIFAQASTRADAAGGIVEVRLGSPTGKLIGTTPAVEVRDPSRASTGQVAPVANREPSNTPGTAPNATGAHGGATTGNTGTPTPNGNATSTTSALRGRYQGVSAAIAPTTGIHDVYFVFKNSKAGANQVLMQVGGIRFGINALGATTSESR